MPKTSVEWTDWSWPVVNGCRRKSPGCENCYAERLSATRLSKTGKYIGLAVMGPHGPRWTSESRLWRPSLDEPLRMRKPAKVFVADMGDLFYEENRDEDIAAIFGVMAAAPQHTFQVLTKRADRMVEWFKWVDGYSKGEMQLPLLLHHAQRLCEHKALRHTDPILRRPWPLPNVWLGVSVENQRYADERIPQLQKTSAVVRFVSYEPALDRVDFTPFLRPKIDWLIVGGESGPGARRFNIDWARDAKNQCEFMGTAFFCKQLGARPYEAFRRHEGSPFELGAIELNDSKGGDMSEWPKDLRVRQFPKVAA